MILACNDEGNLIKKEHKSSGDTWWYSWDHRNRLQGATHREANDNVITDVRFTYDILGRCIIKKVDDDGDGSWDDGTKTVYDGANPMLGHGLLTVAGSGDPSTTVGRQRLRRLRPEQQPGIPLSLRAGHPPPLEPTLAPELTLIVLP